MAGTRNRQTKGDFLMAKSFQEKQAEWHTTPSSIQTPAYPCHGINVQKLPAMALSVNAVDLESHLYGIGANNYVFPTATPSLLTKSMQYVQFYERPALYIPHLPAIQPNQRP